MSYVERVLQPGETLLHKSKLHLADLSAGAAEFLAIFVLGARALCGDARATPQTRPRPSCPWG